MTLTIKRTKHYPHRGVWTERPAGGGWTVVVALHFFQARLSGGDR